MTSYRMHCVNQTDVSYYFGVYQQYPDAPGLTSVAWQVLPLPPISGSGDISWTMDYGVAIAGFDKVNKKYTGQQIIDDVPLGSVYQVATDSQGIPGVVPTTQKTAPNEIKLLNNTQPGQEMTLGFALSGSLLAIQDAIGGEGAEFIVHPSYYVAAFRNIEKGQLVDSGVVVGPVEIEFTNGNKLSNITLAVDAGTAKFSVNYEPGP